MSGEKDFFEVLGLNYSSTPTDVQAAFEIIYQKLQDAKETSHAAKHLQELHNAYLVFRTESTKKGCTPSLGMKGDFPVMSWTTRPAYRQVCPGCGSPFCSSTFRKDEDDEEDGYSDEDDEPDDDEEDYISEGEGGMTEHHQNALRTRQRLREKLEEERQQRRLREQLQMGLHSERREDTRSVDDLIAFIEGEKKAGGKKEKKKKGPAKKQSAGATGPGSVQTENSETGGVGGARSDSVSAKLEQVLMQSLKMAFPAMSDREASHILSEHKTDITSSITALLDKIPQGKRRAPGSAPSVAPVPAATPASAATTAPASAQPSVSATVAAAVQEPVTVAPVPIAAASAPAVTSPAAAAAAGAAPAVAPVKRSAGKQPAPAPVIEVGKSKSSKAAAAAAPATVVPSAAPSEAAKGKSAPVSQPPAPTVISPAEAAKPLSPPAAVKAAEPVTAAAGSTAKPAEPAAVAKAPSTSKQKRAEKRNAAAKSAGPSPDEVRAMVQQLIELIPEDLDEETAALALAAHNYSLPATAEALLDSMSGWQFQGKVRQKDDSDSELSDEPEPVAVEPRKQEESKPGKKAAAAATPGSGTTVPVAGGTAPSAAVRGTKERGIGFVKSMRAGQFGFIVLKDEERAERIGDVFFYVGSHIPSSVNVGSKVEFDMMLSKRYKGKWEAFNIVPHVRAAAPSIPKPTAAAKPATSTAASATAAPAAGHSEHSSPGQTPVSPLQPTPADGTATERTWAAAAGADEHVISGSGSFAAAAGFAAAAQPTTNTPAAAVTAQSALGGASATSPSSAAPVQEGLSSMFALSAGIGPSGISPPAAAAPQLTPLGALTGEALVRARQQLGLVIQVAAGIMRPDEIERIFVESGYNVDRTVAKILAYGHSLLNQRNPQAQAQQQQQSIGQPVSAQQSFAPAAAPISPPGVPVPAAMGLMGMSMPAGPHGLAPPPVPQGLGLSAGILQASQSTLGLSAAAPAFAPAGAHTAHSMLQTPPGVDAALFGPPGITNPQRTPQSVTAAADLSFAAAAPLGGMGGFAAPATSNVAAFGSVASSGMFAPPQAPTGTAPSSGAFYSPLFGGPSLFSPLSMSGVSSQPSGALQPQQQQQQGDDDGISALLSSALTDALDDVPPAGSRLLAHTQQQRSSAAPQTQPQPFSQPIGAPGLQPVGAVGSGLFGAIGSGLRQGTPQQPQVQPQQQQWSLY